MIQRRKFTQLALAAGTLSLLPIKLSAEATAAFVFESDEGKITIYPIHHASFVMETPNGTIYVDPVEDPALYKGLPKPDLIAITHEHPDHYNHETLVALSHKKTEILANPAVAEMLNDDIAAKSKTAVANGESYDFGGLKIEAIPAYNTSPLRSKFHPQGRDNGYIFNFAGFRFYVSGDTEDTPEMRALENIDLAFLCMNLPFTQTAEQAADAVKAFKPKVVVPYHYRGRMGGSQDPEMFAELVGNASEVEMYNWYQELGDAVEG